jgi:hypothetical protein
MPRSQRDKKLEHRVPYLLTVDDFPALNALGGVAGVDDQLRLLDDLGVVVIGMVSNNQDAVVVAQVV